MPGVDGAVASPVVNRGGQHELFSLQSARPLASSGGPAESLALGFGYSRMTQIRTSFSKKILHGPMDAVRPSLICGDQVWKGKLQLKEMS